MAKVGLALGSGGARGFAHLGVIKVLSEHSIPIEMIAGSSMGALVGCFYAFGHDIQQLIKLSTAFKRKYFLDFTVPKMGFIAGNRVKGLIDLFMHGKNIEDLNIPLCIVATDLQTGEKVVFNKGNIAQAVRASIAIPGIITPEKVNGRLLIDGGVVDKVPVSTVKNMGADIVIASDVSRMNKEAEIQNIYDVIMQSIDIMQIEISIKREDDSDIMILPKVEKYNSRAFTHIHELIQMGEQAAMDKIPEIRKLIKQWEEKKETD